MSGALHVIEPGLHTTVQDLGRIGYQRLGLPVSGALDSVALRIANILVGNAPGIAGLEVLFAGPTLEVRADSVRLAVAGGSAAIEVLGTPTYRSAPLQSVRLLRGQQFRIGATGASAVAYLALAGGFALPAFLGSLATYERASLGGLEGRALKTGDLLPLAVPAAEARAEQMLPGFELAPPTRVRVVLGPQDDYFTPAAVSCFLSSPYRVGREADRMGMRLDGPVLAHAKGYNIVSDGIAPGAIQVPGSGLPIMLLADRQTTGGYPKIATVISADLPAIGRLGPGAQLAFEALSIAEAVAARQALETRLAALPGRLQAVQAGVGLDERQLFEANLVSGVVDAHGPADSDD